jgi:hypothetical protein
MPVEKRILLQASKGYGAGDEILERKLAVDSGRIYLAWTTCDDCGSIGLANCKGKKTSGPRTSF